VLLELVECEKNVLAENYPQGGTSKRGAEAHRESKISQPRRLINSINRIDAFAMALQLTRAEISAALVSFDGLISYIHIVGV
jgi:hypothetical protein